MGVASDNQFPKVIFEEVANDGSATTTPAADHRALYVGEDGGLHLKDSSAVVTVPATHFCYVFNSAAQTASPLSFDSEVEDLDGYHAGGSPTRITIPTGLAGVYMFTFSSLGPADTDIKFRKNGTTVVGERGYTATTSPYISHTQVFRLAAADYIEVINGGGSWGHASVFDAQSQLSVVLLGS